METTEQIKHDRTLQGKRVILLGGTSGAGFATAAAAAKEGASVVVVSSRKERVDAALSRLPRNAEGYAVDLANEEEIRGFFSQIGAYDHLVFTAGDPLLVENIAAIDMDSARKSFELRYWGAYMAAKFGSEKIRPGGSITLTSGAAGVKPQQGFTILASICGAIESLTRALAVELQPLRVNAVSFGLMRTEMWNHIPEEDRNIMYETSGQAIPVGRVGEPEDAAEAFLYLMREHYSTGQTIVVDGGSILA
ncbi:SDR family oxidoreductase [Paenibacillus donghaensis]|uniref:SDR family oxidoreductase n=1 Tax=Paenibacillus donghaensis TaxID=414771 RepID=UPI0018845C4C|nr:SDR family oxidoreductase [Paenibacillus donghaensis]MBE9917400.1 SDR family oxidoreductase [Paenibacillus donghaensis]